MGAYALITAVVGIVALAAKFMQLIGWKGSGAEAFSPGNDRKLLGDIISAETRNFSAAKRGLMRSGAAFFGVSSYGVMLVNKRTLWTKNLMKIA